MTGGSILRRLRLDEAGTAVIEAAFVLPILCLLSLGAFEVSRMLARYSELQSALDEITAITLAHAPENQDQIDTIEDILEASTGLADANVTIGQMYRCASAPSLVANKASCATASTVSSYLEIRLNETYTPQWVGFGIGAPVSLALQRTVQFG